MSERIRVLVVDDHDLVRAGIVRLLSDYSELVVVGQAGSAAEALQQAVALQPDVILMDIDLGEVDGITATRQIKQAVTDSRIIILTMYSRESYVLEAIRAGAYGYLLKDVSAAELVSVIGTVKQGGAVISPRLARRILEEFAQRSRGPEHSSTRERGPDDLSSREAEILALIASGETARSIAETLFLSENTVKRHTSNIYHKLHVRHRSEAAAEAVRRGLLPPSPGPERRGSHQ